MGPKTLSQKLSEIRDNLTLVKDAINPHFKNEYVSLGAVLDGLNPLLLEHGLRLSQSPQIIDGIPCIETKFQDLETGEYECGQWPLTISPDPQKVASSSSYARRYSLLCCFALIADDDAEAANGRGSGRSVPRGVKAALNRVK